MLNSHYRELGPVALPPYAARQRYMHTFDLADPIMATGFEDYRDVVVALCAASGAREGVAHMTVDEKIVQAGQSQRRPKPHVDGCFIPAIGRWGHPGWNHYCNQTGVEIGRMPVIIAASVVGCRAYPGVFDGVPANDGDLSHLELPEGELLAANVGYWLSPDCIHESLVMPEAIQRTFLRIALPVED